MKNVILSSDGDSIVYSVPDIVADNLRKYCIEFCDKWLWKSPNAEKYRHIDPDCGLYVAYSVEDFIEYLNTWIFPEQTSRFVKNLGWTDFGKNVPQEYKNCPYFNF